MRPFKPSAEDIIDVNLNGVASILKPVVYVSDGRYYCLLSSDTTQAVLGEGNSPEQAVVDWDARLKIHLATAGNDDQVVKYVKEILNPPNPVDDLFKKYGLRPLDKTKIGK